jgi:RsiW-degrading membrane proteinase PrsW (M82 family)
MAQLIKKASQINFMDFTFAIYIIFGILPSLTWLLYYLRKDKHPESKKMIIKIFLWGAFAAIPVFLVQIWLTKIMDLINLPAVFFSIIYWFLIIALTEEFFKYLVVKLKVLNNPEFDEPIDTMIYMVVSALGFAAVENILYLFSPARTSASLDYIMQRTLVISFIRFIGATFLHTLCSATIGYFLALSFCKEKNRIKMLTLGIILASALHGLYNFSIMTIGDGFWKAIIPIAVLTVLALYVMREFEKLKKIKSVCKL